MSTNEKIETKRKNTTYEIVISVIIIILIIVIIILIIFIIRLIMQILLDQKAYFNYGKQLIPYDQLRRQI